VNSTRVSREHHAVLFVCIHNSARSQMAEAWLNTLCAPQCRAESAGLEPGTLNPIVVEVMAEVGIDIGRNRPRSIEEALHSEARFTHVITVCDETSAERCPVVPGSRVRLHWSFPDPSAIVGPREERLSRTREIRDAIRAKVEAWCGEVRVGSAAEPSEGSP
jgi:arsenate reductase